MPRSRRARPRPLLAVATLYAALAVLLAPPASSDEGRELEVTIEGLDGKLRRNAEIYLKIMDLDGEEVTNEARLRWLHARAAEDIGRALQPFGYYQAEVESDLQAAPEGWRATYQVDPGPRVIIEAVGVEIRGEGKDDRLYREAVAQFPLSPGQPLLHEPYGTLKSTLQAIAAERGYFEARLARGEIQVDLEANTARIVIVYETGPRYRFGEAVFDQDALNEEFLHRYVTFEAGDPYRVKPLLDLQSALIDSDYFEQVEVAAAHARAEDAIVPVDIHLVPDEPRKYTFGLGFGTDTGLRGRAGVEGRRINRRGHKFKLDLLASQIQIGLSGEYIIPGEQPQTDRFILRAGYTEEDSESVDSKTTVIGASQQKQLGGGWQRVASLDFQRETFRFGDDEETSLLLIPSLRWTRIDADDRLRAREGNRITFDIRGAYEKLLSDVSFLQARVGVKWIEPLWEDGRLIARGDAGTTVVSNFEDFPATLRFFAGGDRSVRGYELDSIGTENADGDVVGGKHLLVGSVEYEHSVHEDWAVAAFADAGDAFDNGTPEMRVGVGIGVRWFSPVGPVRLDFASGLDDPGDTFRIHVSIGPDL